jgi:hypothetical protein
MAYHYAGMETNRKWHDWLMSLGTLIALILAGVTFYYQFLRKPRELTAVVLPIDWEGDRKVTVRVAIWNEGSHDEVVESGNVVAEYAGATTVATIEHLFGPEVIKPGDAKAFTVSVEMEEPDVFRRTAVSVTRTAAVSRNEQLKLILELKTIDRNANVIVNRVEMGELSMHRNQFFALSSEGNARLNLLAETWVGAKSLSIIRRAEPIER